MSPEIDSIHFPTSGQKASIMRATSAPYAGIVIPDDILQLGVSTCQTLGAVIPPQVQLHAQNRRKVCVRRIRREKKKQFQMIM